MDNQLPLPELELFDRRYQLPIITFNPPRCSYWLDRAQEHLLTYLLLKDGRMIPPDSIQAETIDSLKTLGLIRDGLEASVIQITSSGTALMCQWFEYLKSSGRMWSS